MAHHPHGDKIWRGRRKKKKGRKSILNSTHRGAILSRFYFIDWFIYTAAEGSALIDVFDLASAIPCHYAAVEIEWNQAPRFGGPSR